MMAAHYRQGARAVSYAEFVSEAESVGLEVCGRAGGGEDSDEEDGQGGC